MTLLCSTIRFRLAQSDLPSGHGRHELRLGPGIVHDGKSVVAPQAVDQAMAGTVDAEIALCADALDFLVGELAVLEVCTKAR